MFVILAYDVGRKRVAKVLKICRQYLIHVQKSVFEGEITPARLSRLQSLLAHVIDTNEDSIIIYCLSSTKYTHKLEIGKVETHHKII